MAIMSKKFYFYSMVFFSVLVFFALLFIFRNQIAGTNKIDLASVRSEVSEKEKEALNAKEVDAGSAESEKESVQSETEEDEKPEEAKNISVGEQGAEPDKSGEENESFRIISKPVSWGYQSLSSRFIDAIIIHSSYDALGSNPYSLDGLLKEYKSYGVAPHYLVDRKGKVYRLVADKNIAYHAGESKVPDGRKNVNDFSIGIELMNTKSDSCTREQYGSLVRLLGYLENKYKIKYILGHNQIASGRKDDPWNFDWDKIK